MRFVASRKRLRGTPGWGSLGPHDDRASAGRASCAGLARPAPPVQAGDPLPGDWIAVPDDEILVFTLSNGRTVTMRLAAGQAPAHVANIRALARAHWWDQGTSVYRVQENYVAQWGDATEKKPLPTGIVANPRLNMTARAAARSHG
ncbi:peptidylprolyl isomerase [Sphingomonas sp. I4]